MRRDQHVGLPPLAQSFLAANKITETCPTCGHVTNSHVEQCGTYIGMFEDEYPLYRYHLKDGRTATEFLQASPWSSGPNFFLGLRVSDGLEFLHEQETVEAT